MDPFLASPFEHRPNRRGRRLQTSVLAAFVLLSGCNSADTPANEGSTHGAYATVIQWFADRVPDDSEKQVVFIEARGEGVGIDLETQASVVEATQSFADVRFIDERSEALESGEVRDDGILLALGPVIVDGSTAVVESDEVLDEDSVTSRRFDLRPVDGEWALRGDPSTLPG